MFAADRATKWLAAAAAALALAGGSFGILSVTTGSSSGAATAAGTGTAVSSAKSSGSAPSWAGKVTPFERGAPSAAKSVGQVPASYKQGSGTIVSGPAASKATRAALAVYPGGIVDRVVRLSNGEYEVHDIGVNWPHHIFVSSAFKVVGAG